MDENGNGSSSTNGSSSRKKRKASPQEEFLLPEDALDSFPYSDRYSLSEIREILNADYRDDTRKKITNVRMLTLMEENGYVQTEHYGQYSYQSPTPLGREKGIITEERTAKSGRVYEVMFYDRNIQEIILRLLV